METSELWILCAAALATSTLSAVIGMAGGIVLLSVMLVYFDPLTAIPLHGVIQLASNGTRTVIQRRAVVWEWVWRYAILLLPMALLGLGLALTLPAASAKASIGVFVLVATWRPGWLMLGTHPEGVRPNRRFLLLGGVSGFLQMTLGAMGPFIAPFFLNLGLERRAIVGTKAAVQTLGHASKILIFGLAGVAYLEYRNLLVPMLLCVLLGTWLGSRLLDRVNERAFRWLYKGFLTLIATRLILLGLVGTGI